jgi:hypothetical protein
MQQILARAALVSAPDVGEGLTTFVSREEVEKAIRANDGPLELILDVTRFSDGEPAETHSVAVAWEPMDLERLLGQAEGEHVTLTFDGEALREAIEMDVEAHGIREKALVLAVAATGVTGLAAGTAAGQSLGPDDRAVARSAPASLPSLGSDDRAVSRSDPMAQQPSLGADDRALPRTDPLSQPSLSPDDRALPRTDPAPATQQPGLSPDDRALPRTDPVAQQPGLSPDDRALPRTDPASQPSLGPDDRALPRTAPQPVAQQPGLSPDDRALPRTDPVSQPSLGPDDRALPRTDPVTQQPGLSPDDRALPRTDPVSQPSPGSAPSDDGTWISAPSPGTVAVFGGIALAITGAAFAAGAASRRRVHPA